MYITPHHSAVVWWVHMSMLCCSKKTLKLKQPVPPPKTPDPVDGRRHIELQARCLQFALEYLLS